MLMRVKQLIFKYFCIKKDLIDDEKFREVKIVNEILADLQKLNDLENKP